MLPEIFLLLYSLGDGQFNETDYRDCIFYRYEYDARTRKVVVVGCSIRNRSRVVG